MSTCTVDDCARGVLARGWRKPRYRRWSEYGSPTGKPVYPERVCERCGESFRKKTGARFCSPGCQNAANQEKVHVRRKQERLDAKEERPCALCGAPIPREEHGVTKYCSRACWYYRNYKLFNRADLFKKNGAFDFSPRDWVKLVQRFGGRCAYCGTAATKLEMDHVVPVSRGGQHSIGNILPARRSCNASKNNHFLMEWSRWVN